MYRIYWTLLIAGIFSSVPPAIAFFEAFSKLAEEIRQIEQSTPGDIDETVGGLQSTAFADVTNDQWFYRYVTPVARWGIVSGYKDSAGKPTGNFGPGNTVTIAEILKMTLKAAQVDETACKGKPGSSQAEQHWARTFVICARERGVRLLTSAPDLDRAATRAEVLSVLFDAFDDTVPPLFSPFKDTVNHPLEPAIAYGAALKIVSGDKDENGKPTGIFRPDASVNRAEATKIIYERLRFEVMGEKD